MCLLRDASTLRRLSENTIYATLIIVCTWCNNKTPSHYYYSVSYVICLSFHTLISARVGSLTITRKVSPVVRLVTVLEVPRGSLSHQEV